MKLICILALILNVAGYGEVPAEGLRITIDQAQEDPLTGKAVMEVSGTVICDSALRVSIERADAEIEDEFCCAGQCTPGNGESSQQLTFTPSGLASWYSHYNPAPNSDTYVRYNFWDGSESRTLEVHYVYATEGIEECGTQPKAAIQKTIRDGQVVIINGKQIITIQGQSL